MDSKLFGTVAILAALFLGHKIEKERTLMKAPANVSSRGFNPGTNNAVPSFWEAAWHLGNRYAELASEETLTPPTPGYSPYPLTSETSSPALQPTPHFPVHQQEQQARPTRWQY